MSARPGRAKLIAVWALLLALIAVIAGVQMKERSFDRAEQADLRKGGDRSRMVVPVTFDEIGSVEIAHAGGLHRFERDPSGTWFYHGAHAPATGTHGHQTDPVMAERIAKAFSALARAKFERELPFDPKQSDYGVLNPATLVLLYRPGESQPLVQYAVGDMAPDGVSRYVLRMGAATVNTLPDYQIKNLIGVVQAATEVDPALAGVRALTGGAAPIPGSR